MSFEHSTKSTGTADELFAAFLERYHAGVGELEELCARHPEHAEEFQRLWQRLQAIGELELPRHAGGAAPGQCKLDEFRLLREIGRGGMGVVYEAEDLVLHRRVAVKVLAEGRRLWGDAAQRFEREVTALSRLAHPHIVTVHRSGLDREPPYLVMELVRGGRSLGDVLEELEGAPPGSFRPERLLPPPRAPGSESSTTTTRGTSTRPGDRTWYGVVARLIAETAEALDHAHQNGVLHRDVKPGNILIDERGCARLVDFGVARVRGEATLTATGGFAGTPSYAAPEQISSDLGEVDGRTDLYSLGVVLYQLLTGRRPFGGEGTREIFNRVLSDDPPEPRRVVDAVPWELSAICSKAIEKRPERRYPSALAMAADLRAFLTHRPIIARPPTLARRVLRGAQRHPWALGVLACVLLAFVLVAAYTVIGSWRRETRLRAEGLQQLEQTRVRGAELAEIFARLASGHRQLDTLADLARSRPLSAEESERRERLARRVDSDRARSTRLLWTTYRELQSYERILGNEVVRAALRGVFLEVLDFARRSGDASYARDVRELLAQLGYRAPEHRGGVRIQCRPADASVQLFRYREERELVGGAYSTRLVAVPCDRRGADLPALSRRLPVVGTGPEELNCAPGNRIDSCADLPSSLPLGSYLLLFRCEGYDDLRLPLLVEEDVTPELSIAMDPVGFAPPGFVKIAAGPFLSGGDRGRSYQSPPRSRLDINGFYIGRAEVTFGEYLEIMRWKAARGTSTRKHIPRDRRGEPPPPWTINYKTFAIDPPECAELPVCSIRYEDALAYCTYRSERARERGEPWIYELPWAMSWEKAARGVDGRIFSWGNEFDWKLCFGRMSRPGARGEAPWIPVRSDLYPGDTSPYGALAMTGDVEEFVFREDRKPPLATPGIKGGGFTRPDPMSYRLPRYVSFRPMSSRGTGFRVVARHRDMPPQGPRGGVARMRSTESTHD